MSRAKDDGMPEARGSADAKMIEVEVGDAEFFEHADGTIVAGIARSDDRGDRIEVHCHGPNDHFRDPDGGCVHVDDILAVQTGAGAPIQLVGYRGYSSREAMEADGV